MKVKAYTFTTPDTAILDFHQLNEHTSLQHYKPCLNIVINISIIMNYNCRTATTTKLLLISFSFSGVTPVDVRSSINKPLEIVGAGLLQVEYPFCY